MQRSSFTRPDEGPAHRSARVRIETHTFASPVVRPLPRPQAFADAAIW